MAETLESNENSLLCWSAGPTRPPSRLDLLQPGCWRSRGQIYRLGRVITASRGWGAVGFDSLSRQPLSSMCSIYKCHGQSNPTVSSFRLERAAATNTASTAVAARPPQQPPAAPAAIDYSQPSNED